MASFPRRIPVMVLAAASLVVGLLAPTGTASAADPSGVQWPAGQELPSFAKPRHLDVALTNGQSTPVDVQILLRTLQGLINRERPQIYVIHDEPAEGSRTWLDDTDVPYRTYADPWQLIKKYLPRTNGVVIYDPAVPETINVATTLAGIRGGVVASPQLAAKLTAAPYNLAVIDDYRGDFGSGLEATAWQFEHLWPQVTHKALVGISPGRSVTVPADNFKDFVELIREDEQIRNGSNRTVHELDLTSYLGGEAVYLRFTDAFPADGWGPAVHKVTVKANDQVVQEFEVGTPEERAMLTDRSRSAFKPSTEPEGAHRFADGTGYWVYRFVPPAGTTKFTVSVDMFNQYVVSASKVRPPVSSDDKEPESLPLRDYALAIGAMPFWLQSNDNPEEQALLDQILASVEKGTPYLGWFTDEFNGVRMASRHGVYVLAADFLENASVHGGVRSPLRAQKALAPPPLQNKAYVTFTLSEGDNLQYVQHHMRRLWDNPDRGKVPLNWSISPLVVDAAPDMWATYQATATKNDLLVAGPSGPGYFFPSLWPADHLQPFLASSKPRYFTKPGLSVMYALDDRSTMRPEDGAAYRTALGLKGAVFNMWFGQSDTSIVGGLPVSRQLAFVNRTEMANAIKTQMAAWDGQSPLFVAVGVPAWDLTPTDLAWVADQLGPQAVPVRGDHYFDLMRKAGVS